MNLGRMSTYSSGEGKPTNELNDLRETNYTAPLRFVAAALPRMREMKSGVIVNVTSTKKHNPDPFHIPYAEFKAKLSKVTGKIAQHEKQFGIRVVDLQPGNTKTNIERGTWVPGNDAQEVEAATALHNWWRSVFGNNPINVAQTIYEIAEGKVLDDRVLTGFDARLTSFLHANIPGWEKMFGIGYGVALFTAKIMLRLRNSKTNY